jgi:hypothetical protein
VKISGQKVLRFIYEGAGDPDPPIGIVEAHKSSALA